MTSSAAVRTDVDPASVQPLHGDVEALALLADPVGHGHSAVFQDYLPRRLRVPAKLQQALITVQSTDGTRTQLHIQQEPIRGTIITIHIE